MLNFDALFNAVGKDIINNETAVYEGIFIEILTKEPFFTQQEERVWVNTFDTALYNFCNENAAALGFDWQVGEIKIRDAKGDITIALLNVKEWLGAESFSKFINYCVGAFLFMLFEDDRRNEGITDPNDLRAYILEAPEELRDYLRISHDKVNCGVKFELIKTGESKLLSYDTLYKKYIHRRIGNLFNEFAPELAAVAEKTKAEEEAKRRALNELYDTITSEPNALVNFKDYTKDELILSQEQMIRELDAILKTRRDPNALIEEISDTGVKGLAAYLLSHNVTSVVNITIAEFLRGRPSYAPSALKSNIEFLKGY